MFVTEILCNDWIDCRGASHVFICNIRPMKLDYQFLAQIFENLMRAGGYYSLFIIFPKAQHTSKHEDFCQKTVRTTLITLELNS